MHGSPTLAKGDQDDDVPILWFCYRGRKDLKILFPYSHYLSAC